MEFRKMVLMILHAGLQKRHRHKGQTFGLSGRGEGGMIEENSTETYITICKTDDQCKFSA